MRHARREPDFGGAFFSGSTVGMRADDPLPVTSDIDVLVVLGRDSPPEKLGKFVYNGVLLDVGYLSWSQLSDVVDVLSTYYLAGSFRTNTIIADPTGHLRSLYDEVAPRFAKRAWVRRRCDDAVARIEGRLGSIDANAPLAEQVLTWLFGTGVSAHVILVAARRNPTVRRRYLAAREVLIEHDLADFYPDLLDLLGCVHLTRKRVDYHVQALIRTFDTAVSVSRSKLFFSTDISPAARAIAIDGSQDLIAGGYHREAMFWIVATLARCHVILAADAPRAVRHELTGPFEAALGDLGVATPDAITGRANNVLQFLPVLRDTADDIVLAGSRRSRR
jgi:hypothetical protein